ncbi:polysaccharide deacetylase family protein, partial [Escherichia coli]|nr:polysaccharide deacetylase family protein [Escherichia coli]
VRHSPGKEYSHRDCEHQIATGNADNVMLRWSEVNEMLQSGLVEFHVHTHTHTRWDKKFTSREEQCKHLRQDLLSGREYLKKMTGKCSKHLCWPEGYYNKDYIQIAEELGFHYLYTTERRMNAPAKGTTRIGRISTKERENCVWLKRRLFYYTTPFFSSLLFRLARAWDRRADAKEALWARLFTPAAKFVICKRGMPFVAEAMEVLGG